jgi:hypoxanthine phosphoribosyltransferase
MSKSTDTKIKNLGKSVFERQNGGHEPYTLLLGAGASISSNCPSWWRLCEQYCNDYLIQPSDGDYIAAFKEQLKKQSKNRTDIYLAFAKSLNNVEPSIGYLHLATLIAKGVFKTIITTNFDNLLEKALSKIMPIDDIKVLIRGEVTDDYIADFIEKGIPKIKIIKLHGDLQSNIFFYQDEQTFKISKRLEEVLKKDIDSGSLIVGSEMSDSDLLGIYHGNNAHNIFVNPKLPNQTAKQFLNLGNETNNTQIISNTTTKKIVDTKEIIIEEKNGEFDTFFTELNLEFQRHFIRQKEQERKAVEKTILDKQEKGTGYINYSRLGNMVTSFWNEIKDRYDDSYPDAIVFINDPTAPGGMELKRRMVDMIKNDYNNIVIETVKIEGTTRYYKREVTSAKPTLNFKSKNGHKNILILDAISFSGNTMKIEIKKYAEWFPKHSIRGGIMVIDDQLKRNVEHGDDELLKDVIYSKTTDRHEIFFPWGVTQATSDCKRELKGLDSNYPVTISKRPWGTIEILAQQRNCSVRILTIEADQKLSFQRHLVRDEFFISLDENIGLEICAETLDNLSEEVDINNIKEIKSLVLEKGDYILIPKGIWHRTKASKERVRLLELGFGAYDQYMDIERIDDKFGRKNLDGSE